MKSGNGDIDVSNNLKREYLIKVDSGLKEAGRKVKHGHISING